MEINAVTIINKVSDTFEVSPKDIISENKDDNVVKARKIAIYITRQLSGLSIDHIGKIFGKRDHCTILYNITQVEKEMKNDIGFNEIIEKLISDITVR